MNRRLELLRLSLLHLTFGGSLKSWFFTCFGPTSGTLAKRHIEAVNKLGEFNEIKIRGHETTLFYSNFFAINSIYQSLEEQLYSWQWHFYQTAETKIEQSDVVFDCGCAEGIFTLFNHTKAQKIYAFEPLPHYLCGLHKTFDSIDNVSIINCALGNYTGVTFIREDGIASSITQNENGCEVPIDTIDNFCRVNKIRPSYLKIDVEGYELELLKGACETIKSLKPKIAIATYHKKDHDIQIRDLLYKINNNYNFKLSGIDHFHNGGSVLLHAW